MEPADLIAALSDPGAYPHPVDRVIVHQTHISAVFLAGDHVYKIKKPVDLGFLDFTSLERRRHFCEEEVRLNRRLAPGVYRGVVPVVRSPGGLRVNGRGEPVEWAVWMDRLPDDATLLRRLGRGEVGPDELRVLARRLAGFHRDADGGPAVARWARWDVVAANARDNLAAARDQVGHAVEGPVVARLSHHTDRLLTALRDRVEARAAAGMARDTHGDLHLDHVYRFPDRPEPDDWVIVDCIEFNERFRCADPVADIAFLAMDLRYRGRPDLADAFSDAYLDEADDAGGADLLPLYTSYRAAVRAKVDGIASRETEIPPDQRAALLASSRAHWLMALALAAPPGDRPAVVAVSGLPGTGKSTVARHLARAHGFLVLSSDRVRKELAGLDPEHRAGAPPGEGIYAPGWTTRTYDALFDRAIEVVRRGARVVLDATFGDEGHRRRLADLALELGVPSAVLVCSVPDEVALARIAARRGDASDADAAVYRHLARGWHPPRSLPHQPALPVSDAASADAALARAGLAD